MPASQAGDVLLEEWVSSVGASIQVLREATPGVDDWILHYREFRSRLHGGRSPQYGNVISPLAGLGLERLSNLPGKAEHAQVHFDVMASLYPELLHFPYDDNKKAPSDAVFERLTTVKINSTPSAGRCYIASDVCEEVSAVRDRCSAIEILLAEFHDSNTKEVRELMPEIVAKALAAAQEVRGQRKFGHASDAKNISRVMAAALALSMK